MAFDDPENPTIIENFLSEYHGNLAVLADDYLMAKRFLDSPTAVMYEYLFFYRDTLYHLNCEEDIKDIQERLVSAQDYRIAKDFNEYLIAVWYRSHVSLY